MKSIQEEYRKGDEIAEVIARNYRYAINLDLAGDPPAMILDDSGTITSCNGACAELLGCTPPEVAWHHISKFIPKLQEAMLFNEHHLNPHLRFLSRIGHHFKAVKGDGTYFASKVFFVELGNSCDSFIRVIMRPVEVEAMHS